MSEDSREIGLIPARGLLLTGGENNACDVGGDVDADTVEGAARQTLAIQRIPGSTATVFDVTDETGASVRVDLDDTEDFNHVPM